MPRAASMTDALKPPQFRTHPSQARAFYDEHGYHVEYDVWSAREIDAINQAARSIAGRAHDDYRPLMHPHRQSDVFMSALGNPRIVEMMDCLLGGEVSGLQTEYFFGAPETEGFALHQDNFYLETGQHVFGSSWSGMTDISPANGGIFFYPGTHLEPVLPTRALEGNSGPNQDPNAANEESVVPAGYEPVDVRIPAGTTVVLHGHLVHGSHKNRSTGFRNVLLNTYIRKGEKFRAGNTAKRAEVNVHDIV